MNSRAGADRRARHRIQGGPDIRKALNSSVRPGPVSCDSRAFSFPGERRSSSECDGRHATLRRSRTRFDSWRGHSPRVCREHGGVRSRKAGSDSRAGDGPFRMSSGCGGWHATLRRSRARFNSWRGHDNHDAGARWPGNRLQPGRSGFDSHRRLSRGPRLPSPEFQASG
ncbi:MAG: hypothetical protein JWN86_464 [Planctomycetota bacterium]|nr:hypothetical protein [Planctomycetota bacterium]